MITPLPQKLPAQNKYAATINKLIDVCRSLRPMPSPGVLTDQTPRGVHRRAQAAKSGAGGGALVECAVNEVKDDYLVCTRYDNSATIHVAKPPALQCSAWNPGWQPGVGNTYLTANYDRPDPTPDDTFDFAWSYVSPEERYFIHGQGEAAIDDILDSVADVAIDYQVWREIIFPAYRVTNTSASSQVNWRPLIYATRIPSGVLAPSGSDVLTDDADDPIYWIDTNVDARQWRVIQEVFPTQHVAAGAQHWKRNRTQNSTQTTGNTSPDWT